MKIPITKYVLLIFIISLNNLSHAQIVSPDFVCVGDSVHFDVSGDMNYISYAWEFGTNSLAPILTTSVPVYGTGTDGNMFSVVDQATMVYDTAVNRYYAFVTSCSLGGGTPSVQRLDFGADPHSVPVAVDLGNPSGAFTNVEYSNLEAVEIVKDETGIYHAFFTSRGIVHWVFGDGIDSPPTEATRIFEDFSVLGMGMQLAVIKDGNEWLLFAGQTSGANRIVRFNLGSDLNAIPATIPTISLPPATDVDFYEPSYFAIIKEGNDWHMFVSLLYSSSPLVRYDFGSNIQNNTPAVTTLSIPASSTSYNRGINFIKSCDTFFLLSLGQDGTIEAFDFHGDVSSTPTSTSLGAVYGAGVNMNILKPYWYNDTLWALSGNWNNNPVATVYRFPLLGIPSGNAVIRYWEPATDYVFDAPGIYNVTLYCDQADSRGPFAFCKQIVVGGGGFLGNDTTLCNVESYVLNTTGTGSGYLWSTGATTPSITVTASGTYWVEFSSPAGCSSRDTVVVTFASAPQVSLGNDSIVCGSDTITLKNLNPDSGSYLWSNGSTDPSINITGSGEYWVRLSQGADCYTMDTVNYTFVDLSVDLGEDVKVCNDQPIDTTLELNISSWYNILWSNGSSASSVTLREPGTYWVKITYGTCLVSDTIKITSVDCSCTMLMPGAFSPNSDGVNDEFKPALSPDCPYKAYAIAIYNRWGQRVFFSTDPAIGWDGNYNGKHADVGTYFYEVELLPEDQPNVERKKGDLILLR